MGQLALGHNQANTNLASLGQQKWIAEADVVSNRCVATRLLYDGLSNIKNKKSEPEGSLKHRQSVEQTKRLQHRDWLLINHEFFISWIAISIASANSGIWVVCSDLPFG